jgi:hypothetical protein
LRFVGYELSFYFFLPDLMLLVEPLATALAFGAYESGAVSFLEHDMEVIPAFFVCCLGAGIFGALILVFCIELVL